MVQSGAVGLVLAVALVGSVRPCAAQQVVVQQPAFQQFAAPTTVLVPDRGGAFLGGTRGGFQGRDIAGPIPLGSARAGGAGASSTTARVYVHDFRAMDEALLRGGDTEEPRPGLSRTAPARAREPVAQLPAQRGGWLRRTPPRR
jgi:hypothetical protein